MGTLHTFKGTSFARHLGGEKCVCKPRRAVDYKPASVGRGGRHQGYKTQVTFHHNPFEDEK